MLIIKQTLLLFKIAIGTSGCSINPCLNGGSCYVTSDGQQTCSCLPQYIGTFCQSRILLNKLGVN
jgi:hypothetical protein